MRSMAFVRTAISGLVLPLRLLPCPATYQDPAPPGSEFRCSSTQPKSTSMRVREELGPRRFGVKRVCREAAQQEVMVDTVETSCSSPIRS